jgi:RNA polymerase sigma-70 factor (ECF subfamily)
MVSATNLEEHHAALTGHCYRMLGSVTEAEDAVQDTMLRAWRSRGRFEGRSSLRTWLLRIATNVCLDALAQRRRRARPAELAPAGSVDDALEERPHEHWLEPVPDELALPADADPAERMILRESIRLAFVSALQTLPPRQRAALLLTQVLGWSAAGAAVTLDTSVPAVNSALQRARATLAEHREPPSQSELSPEQGRLLEAYVAAFERYDVDSLTALLHEDATFSMPPYALWLRGPEAVRAWLLGRGCGCRGSRLVPVAANASPAFAQYRDDGRTPWALAVLELEGDRIVGWTSFLDTARLFPRFGLPPTLPPVGIATASDIAARER